MNCDSMAARLTDLLEGDLSEDEEAAALEHLSTCESCERVLAATRSNIDTVHGHGRLLLSDADRQRLIGEITDQLTD